MSPDDTAKPERPTEAAPEVPERQCPYCGGAPSDVTHHLSDLGYLHDDQRHLCAECGKSYTSGVPRGVADRDYWHDLLCPSCGRLGRVHRIAPQAAMDKNDVIGLHLKCPNRFPFDCPECDREVSPEADLVGVATDVYPDLDDVVFACPHCYTALKRDDLNGCYHFWTVQRLVGPHGYALVGWPDTTGTINPECGRSYGTVEGAVRPGEQPDT